MRSASLLFVLLACFASTDASAAKLTKLAQGSTSIVYTHKGKWAVKSMKRFFYPSVQRIKLTRLERIELAAEVGRLTRQLRTRLGSVIPNTRAQRGRGVVVQRLVSGGEDLEYIWDEPRRSLCLANQHKLIDAAKRELGLPGHEEAGRDSWSIDTSDHNFLFDKQGQVVSWFDPVFPPAAGWTGAQRLPSDDGKIQREVRTLIGKAEAPVSIENQRAARARLAMQWKTTMYHLKTELGDIVSEPRLPAPGILEEDAPRLAVPLRKLSEPAHARALREKDDAVARATSKLAGSAFTLDTDAQRFAFDTDGKLIGWQMPLRVPKQVAAQ
jgi:hypothetical protein